MNSSSQDNYRPWFPYAVLLAGIALTFFAAYFAWRSFALSTSVEFNESAQAARARIESRLGAYIALLHSGAGLLAANPGVTEAEFRAYVERLHLNSNYPGIQGIGFSARLEPSGKTAFEEQVRAAGRPDFRIWPEESRDEYHTILYLEPLDRRNAAAIGYDMFTDPIRRTAMEQARDSGHRALSGKVTLVQEIDPAKQHGFLIYLPIYRNGEVPATVEERRAALLGFIYSPFRAGDLFQNLLEEKSDGLKVEVYDGPEISAAALLFETEEGRVKRRWFRRNYRSVAPMEIAGRTWTVRVSGEPSAVFGDWVPPTLLILGCTLSLVLFGLTCAEARARHAAELYSARMAASEQALRQAEERWRLMLETAQDYAIFSLSPEGRVTSWNQGAEGMFGYAEREIVGRNSDVIFTPEDRSHGVPQREMELALEKGFSQDDRVHQRKDGARLFVSGVVRPMFDASGRHLGFLKITRDVTERMEAEQNLRREKEFSETIVNSLPGVFYLFDKNGNWLRWNDSVERITGYTGQELRRRHPLEMIAPEDRNNVARQIEKVLAEGQSNATAHLLTRDAERLPFLFSGRRIILNGLPCVMGLGVDISEQKRSEDELRRAEERLRNYTTELEQRVAERTSRLQESVQSLEGVLYHVAHDLRAPLRSMASFTQLLLDEYAPQLDAQGRNYSERIVASARRMDQLVQDLLAYGRLAHMPVPLTTVSLETEINVVLENFAREIKARGALVHVEHPLPPVRANSGVLNEVLSQLVSNALNFVPLNTPPSIRIFAADGGSVRLFIEDNGIGIQPTYHERIFRIFERLHVEEPCSGTGIGLALVQKGVERMGGKVGVKSTPGEGSCFWVELPPG